MELFANVTDDNLMMYAARSYYNPRSTHVDEFHDDLKRFNYIKRLVSRYQETGKLSERLILNHMIVVFNVFNIQPALNILNLKLHESQWSVVKPFLVKLNFIRHDQLTHILMDETVVTALRKI